MLQCNICRTVFKRATQLRRHLIKKHSTDVVLQQDLALSDDEAERAPVELFSSSSILDCDLKVAQLTELQSTPGLSDEMGSMEQPGDVTNSETPVGGMGGVSTSAPRKRVARSEHPPLVKKALKEALARAAMTLVPVQRKGTKPAKVFSPAPRPPLRSLLPKRPTTLNAIGISAENLVDVVEDFAPLPPAEVMNVAVSSLGLSPRSLGQVEIAVRAIGIARSNIGREIKAILKSGDDDSKKLSDLGELADFLAYSQ